MAPDTTRKAVNLAAADARRAIEALQEQSISLQCELAEARAEIESLKSRASLTPLTDPSVRGVLVDDGEPTNYPPVRSFFIHPERGLMMSIAGRTEAVVQPVRLRPASEFGVPAESAQKLVPLPEGARVFVPKGPRRVPKCREYFFDPIWGHGVFQALWDYDARAVKVQICELLDPALYGVPAERVGGKQVPDGWLLLKPDTVNYHIGWLGKYYAVVDPETMPATTSNLDDCEACLDDCNALVADLRKSLQDERMFAEKKQSEAEQLRKAIETHKRDVEDDIKAGATKSTKLPASYDERLWDALTPPTAASGEGDDMKIGKCFKCGGKLLNGHKCPPQFRPPSAPAAESEGGDGWQSHKIHFDAREMAALESLAEGYGHTTWPDAIVRCKAERDSLSARLAACEEDLKDLRELWEVYKNAPLGSEEDSACFDALEEIIENKPGRVRPLLAPKAEGAERCG